MPSPRAAASNVSRASGRAQKGPAQHISSLYNTQRNVTRSTGECPHLQPCGRKEQETLLQWISGFFSVPTLEHLLSYVGVCTQSQRARRLTDVGPAQPSD